MTFQRACWCLALQSCCGSGIPSHRQSESAPRALQMAAADSETPVFARLDLPEDSPAPTASLLALAESSGGLVHDATQMAFFASVFVCPCAGSSMVWLQTRPKYGAPKTAVIAREMVPGGGSVSDFGRRAIRLLDPRPGAYTLRAPKRMTAAADEEGEMPVDLRQAVLYCTTNARSERAAAAQCVAEYSSRVAEEARRLAAAAAQGKPGGADPPTHHRLDKRYLAAAQREESMEGRAVWRTLDVDDKAAVGPCMKLLDDAGVSVEYAVETRGGVHLMVRPAVLGRALRELAPKLAALRTTAVHADGEEAEHEAVEVKTDCGCPVPGVLQGGFPVCFVDPAALPRE